MNEQLAAAGRVLPEYLGQHVMLSAAALALGLVISLPLAIAAVATSACAGRYSRSRASCRPSRVSRCSRCSIRCCWRCPRCRCGCSAHGFSALGFLPSLLALTLYSMLPIIRNGVAGIVNLDPAVIEAAHGVGMTDRQRLLRVELPLAAPMLMAGIRTAAVWVIGAATLSTPVGQTSLGNYIFSGLQVENWVSVLFGCVAAAALALVTDQLLALIETGVAQRSSWRVWRRRVALLAGIVAAAAPLGRRRGTYVIGAKNFSEQYILAALMEDRIARRRRIARRSVGPRLRDRLSRARERRHRRLRRLLRHDLGERHGSHATRRRGASLLEEMAQWLQSEHGVVMLGALGFENAYALAMRRDRAAALGVRTIADLAPLAPQLAMGGDFEFFVRPEWPALRDGYGLAFASQRQFQPTFMYQALTSGEVDVISAFSSDGRIAANDLVVLEDPRRSFCRTTRSCCCAAARARSVLRERLQPLVGRSDRADAPGESWSIATRTR